MMCLSIGNVDSITTGNFSALDYKAPYTFIEWSKRVRDGTASAYSKYVTAWKEVKAAEQSKHNNDRVGGYVDLLTRIKDSGDLESQIAALAAFNDPLETSVVIPAFARKLKETALKIRRTRFGATSPVIKNGLRGTTKGVGKLFEEVVSGATDIRASEIQTEIHELWGTGDPTEVQPSSAYDLSGDAKELETFISTRLYTIPMETILQGLYAEGLELDALNSIQRLLASDANAILSSTDSSALQITADYDSASAVPKYLTSNYDGKTPNLYLLIEAAKKYLSVNICSTSATNTKVVISPSHAWAGTNTDLNITIASLEGNDNLKTKKEIGGYLIPPYIGEAFYITPDIGVRAFDGVYSNPNVFDVASGEVIHTENTNWMGHDFAYESKKYTPSSSRTYQKFDGYRASEQTDTNKGAGFARAVDPLSFWTGDFQNVWDSRYIENRIDQSAEKLQFFVTDKKIHKWVTDIYGNSYALLKDSSDLYTQMHTVGELVVRNSAGEVTPTDSFFEALIKKHPFLTSVKEQVIDLIIENNTLVIETPLYIIVDTFGYDYDTQKITVNPMSQTISKNIGTYAGVWHCKNNTYVVFSELSYNGLTQEGKMDVRNGVAVYRYANNTLKQMHLPVGSDTSPLLLGGIEPDDLLTIKNACVTGNNNAIQCITQIAINGVDYYTIVEIEDDEN